MEVEEEKKKNKKKEKKRRRREEEGNVRTTSEVHRSPHGNVSEDTLRGRPAGWK